MADDDDAGEDLRAELELLAAMYADDFAIDPTSGTVEVVLRPQSDDSAFRFESPVDSYCAPGMERQPAKAPQRQSRPALPSATLVRKIITARKLRARFLDAELFADPAWDMLLDLTAARVEHQRVSVTSLCIASGVPPTTALRWIGQMTEAGLFERVEDDCDRRRAFIRLSDKAADGMARYFAELGSDAKALV